MIIVDLFSGHTITIRVPLVDFHSNIFVNLAAIELKATTLT